MFHCIEHHSIILHVFQWARILLDNGAHSLEFLELKQYLIYIMYGNASALHRPLLSSNEVVLHRVYHLPQNFYVSISQLSKVFALPLRDLYQALFLDWTGDWGSQYFEPLLVCLLRTKFSPLLRVILFLTYNQRLLGTWKQACVGLHQSGTLQHAVTRSGSMTTCDTLTRVERVRVTRMTRVCACGIRLCRRVFLGLGSM